jgi:hypothetical protein
MRLNSGSLLIAGLDSLKIVGLPTKVIWSAGDLFPKITIERSNDDKYCGVYHCYVPMLLQAEVIFPDGGREVAHVYARIPEEKR